MSEPTWTMTPCGHAYSQCPREAEARQGRAYGWRDRQGRRLSYADGLIMLNRAYNGRYHCDTECRPHVAYVARQVPA